MLLAYDTSAHHSVAGACIALGRSQNPETKRCQSLAMAITFQLPRSQHLPCLALRQHEECDMFFSPGIKKYQKIFHVSRDGIEAIQDNFDFQDGIYADAKEKVPEINHTFHSGI